jgi:hypothetical protein
MTIVNRVLRVPTIRAREDSPDFVEAAALRTALGLKEPEAPRRELPELPQRSRAAG